MKSIRSAFSALLLIAVSAVILPAATLTTVESVRAHAATGAFGCTVSGVTVATPAVVTCTLAHNLIDGDPIQITGVGGTTTVNTVGFAKRTSYTATTFGFYSDAALTTGITGTGSYTSGGAVSEAFDVSAATGDYDLKLRIDTMTATKHALIAIQESQDGFVSDIRYIAVLGLANVPSVGQEYIWKSRAAGLSRFGTANTRIRFYVQAIDSATTFNASLWLEQ